MPTQLTISPRRPTVGDVPQFDDAMQRISKRLKTLGKPQTNIIPFPNPIRRVGIYAGSFNPFHVGHLNIARKAKYLFDKVVIVQARSGNKPKPDKGLGEYRSLGDFELREWDGLLTDFIETYQKPNTKISLVRGLRNIVDLNSEIALTRFYEDLLPGLSIVHIICDRDFEHISSSAIRDLQKYNEGARYIVE